MEGDFPVYSIRTLAALPMFLATRWGPQKQQAALSITSDSFDLTDVLQTLAEDPRANVRD